MFVAFVLLSFKMNQSHLFINCHDALFLGMISIPLPQPVCLSLPPLSVCLSVFTVDGRMLSTKFGVVWQDQPVSSSEHPSLSPLIIRPFRCLFYSFSFKLSVDCKLPWTYFGSRSGINGTHASPCSQCWGTDHREMQTFALLSLGAEKWPPSVVCTAGSWEKSSSNERPWRGGVGTLADLQSETEIISAFLLQL